MPSTSPSLKASTGRSREGKVFPVEEKFWRKNYDKCQNVKLNYRVSYLDLVNRELLAKTTEILALFIQLLCKCQV